MLAIKTEKYKFLTKDPQAEIFVKAMRDKYEWGGAEVYVKTEDGLTTVGITSLCEITEADLETGKGY